MVRLASLPSLFLPPGARPGRGKGPGVAKARKTPAALRIPNPRMDGTLDANAAGGPQIFVHEGERQRLERRLELAAGGPVQLAVTDNVRRMLSHKRERGTLKVRAHMMFLGAPEAVREALVRYVVHDDPAASRALGEFIRDNAYRIRATQPVRGPLRPKGRVHDLERILRAVQDEHFDAHLGEVWITWGRRTRPPAGARRAIKLGSYSAVERLIRIHPALDKEWVPRYFIEYVVYHELLHHVIPAIVRGGRTLLHTPEFEEKEREFRYFERAIDWERRNIARLLRTR